MPYWTSPPNVFFVAEINGLVVGSIAFQRLSHDNVEMNRLSVDSNFRGLGIGRKLVDVLAREAKNNGYKIMSGNTSEFSVAPMKLFRRTGFRFTHFPEQSLIYSLNGIKLFAYEKIIQ